MVERETGRRRRREEVEGVSAMRKKKKMKKMKKKTILLRETRKFKVISERDYMNFLSGGRKLPAFAIIKEERYSMKVSSYDKYFGFDDYDDDDLSPLRLYDEKRDKVSESDDDDDGMKMLPYPSSHHFASGFATAIWKSRIFFISGKIHGQYPCTPNVFAFHTKSKKWRDCTPIPTPRNRHVAVVVKHRIYVFGGATFLDHTISEDHWGQRYDIKKQTWKNLPSPPSVLYQLHTPTAFAVYYKCQAFTYTTKHHKPHQVPQNQNLILFPLPRSGPYQFPISVFNCTENKWLPDLFPDFPSDAPPFVTRNLFPNILPDRLAVIDGVLIWHHRGTIQGYDFLESKYLPELHTLPPNTGYESDYVCHPPMFLVHPGGDNKLHLIFQCVDYIVQCHVLLIQLRQPGPRLSLHFHSHSSLSTEFMGQDALEDVLLIYSGITCEMLNGVNTTLQDIQQEFIQLVYKETILVGHSLENDLLALKISHNLVIDTAILYKNPRGAGYKSALRVLARKFLSREIQGSGNGHDSIEDARTAMELTLLKIKYGPEFGSPPSSSYMRKKLVTLLSESGQTCSLIDDVSVVKRYAADSCHAFPVSSDDEALSKARKEVKKEKVHFIWTQFSELYSYYKRQAEDTEKLNANIAEMMSLLTCRKGIRSTMTSEMKNIIRRMDTRIQSLYTDLPKNAMLIVCTGHGNTAIVQRLRKMLEQNETTMCREKLVKVLEELQAQAEVALCFVRVKN